MVMRYTYGPREVRLARWAASQPEWQGLSHSAKIRYAVGLLVCDDTGQIGPADLARVDQRVYTLARRLLSEVGAL